MRLVRNTLSRTSYRTYFWNSPSSARKTPHSSSLLRGDSVPIPCSRSEDIDFGIVGGLADDKGLLFKDGSLSVEYEIGIEGTEGASTSVEALPRNALSGRLDFLPIVLLLLDGVPTWPLVVASLLSLIVLALARDGGLALLEPDSSTRGPFAEASRLFGDGDLEAEIHDFLAKVVKDPETERRLLSGPWVSFEPSLVDSYAKSLVPRRGPKANFDTVILEPTNERVDFRLNNFLPLSFPCKSSMLSDACLLNDCRKAFPFGFTSTFSEKVRLMPLLSGVECGVGIVGIWVKLADRGSEDTLRPSKASDVGGRPTLLAAAAESSGPCTSILAVII